MGCGGSKGKIWLHVDSETYHLTVTGDTGSKTLNRTALLTKIMMVIGVSPLFWIEVCSSIAISVLRFSNHFISSIQSPQCGHFLMICFLILVSEEMWVFM